MGRVQMDRPASSIEIDSGRLPTIKGLNGAHHFITEVLGVPVTRNLIRTATESKRLRRFKISAHNWYSEADLYEWVLSLRNSGGDAA
ncbi:hypothetical protein [Rhodococcus sp. IEGM 1318]|uniref:hypothetical protein n=1 Tax=Rhodococcus sp. IEGM 1318 TaxID=3082226 RepID=UPI0029535383|nr:hypothetical protein [Rhodococcus sp. IEGM 1318]MDV8008626.1 hypothetical protein [Rhodococcus sp. IEGM 1318]